MKTISNWQIERALVRALGEKFVLIVVKDGEYPIAYAGDTEQDIMKERIALIDNKKLSYYYSLWTLDEKGDPEFIEEVRAKRRHYFMDIE